MKKAAISLLIFLCTLFCALSFIACGIFGGDNGGEDIVDAGGGQTEDNLDDDDSRIMEAIDRQYNENIKYSLYYTSAEECPNGNITDANLHTYSSFTVNSTYYVVVDFTISSFEMADWENSFNASVKVSPSTVIDVTLEEAATGNFTQEEEDNGINITTTYSIPEDRTQERTYRIVVRLIYNEIGYVNIGLVFYGDGEDSSEAYVAQNGAGKFFTVGLGYSLDENGQSYTVTEMAAATDTKIVIPSYYWGLPVTAIADSAFKNRADIETVKVHEGIAAIGANAFEDCTSLTTVRWDAVNCQVEESPDAAIFGGCSNLTKIIIGDSVEALGAYTFYGCSIIKELEVPKNVASMGYAVFGGSSSLERMTIPFAGASVSNSNSYKTTLGYLFGSEEYVGGIATQQYYNSSLVTYYIPELLKSVSITNENILCASFQNCQNITEVILNSVSVIGNDAFNNCINLANITIPSYVTSYGDSAFKNCLSIKSIALPESLITLGNSAFYSCTNLESVTLNDSLTTIKDSAFADCINLEDITIPKSVTSIGVNAFAGCEKFSDITIPGSVATIGDGAFQECTGLKTITLSESITTIGASAFQNCNSVESITIPNSVTEIGSGAFWNCTSLSNVKIGTNVTEIGNYAFENCTNLKTITIPAAVTSIRAGAFKGCTNLISVVFANPKGWYVTKSFFETSGIDIDCSNAALNASDLAGGNYSDFYWRRK